MSDGEQRRGERGSEVENMVVHAKHNMNERRSREEANVKGKRR